MNVKCVCIGDNMKYKNKETTKLILKSLLQASAICLACSSPYYARKVFPKAIIKLIRQIKYEKRNISAKRFRNSFTYLKRNGLIKIVSVHNQMYISLTEEGKKKAGKYQIDNLKIKKPWIWDKKWRILIFDIKDKQKIKREALRGKIKNLGLYQLQKSVWVHPYNFFNEIELLREFFWLNNDEIKMIVADKIEDDQKIRKFFNL